jgi:hypothetical protein
MSRRWVRQSGEVQPAKAKTQPLSYNRIVKASALAVLLLCLVGCSSKGSIDTKEAVRQGVIDYLAGRQNLNVSSMNVSVTSVTFKENEADAMVSFAPKGGGGGQPVSIPYTLERKGNRWVVKPRAAGESPHGGAMPSGANPHGAAPPSGGAGPAESVPPGHPPVPQK